MTPIVNNYAAAATLNLSGSEGLVAYAPAGGAYGVRRATAATQEPIGVIVSADNSSGGNVGIAELGQVKCYAGATFTPTTTRFVMASPSGRLIPFTGLSTNYCVGKLVFNAAVASGDIIDVIVNPCFISSN